jgi:tellurite methyltransferase
VSEADRTKWDGKYAGPGYLFGDLAREVLLAAPLPAGGRALDVACGEGQNAVFLAELGFEVRAVDISPVGLAKARALAQSRGVSVDFRQVDLDEFIPQGPYDVIVCTHYLDRALFPRLEAALAPDGIFIGEWPLSLRSFPVAKDEPPRWFPHLQVLLHRADDEVVQFIAAGARFVADATFLADRSK